METGHAKAQHLGSQCTPIETNPEKHDLCQASAAQATYFYDWLKIQFFLEHWIFINFDIK